MTKHNRFKDVPHFSLIKENGTITIPSVFMFKKGCKELFPFLAACSGYNCTVYFKNEDITINPDSEGTDKLLLTIYMSLIESPKIANDYLRYLSNIDFMNWETMTEEGYKNEVR